MINPSCYAKAASLAVILNPFPPDGPDGGKIAAERPNMDR